MRSSRAVRRDTQSDSRQGDLPRCAAKRFTHFDGARRIYPRSIYEERIRSDLRKFDGKRAGYTKCFKLLGGVGLTEWCDLTARFFAENDLVLEYLGGPAHDGEGWARHRPSQIRWLRYVHDDPGCVRQFRLDRMIACEPLPPRPRTPYDYVVAKIRRRGIVMAVWGWVLDLCVIGMLIGLVLGGVRLARLL